MTDTILLDTPIWIWLMLGDKSLGKAALSTIENASICNKLSVSTISLWELAMLERKGRIALGCSVHDWIKKALGFPGLSLANISPKIAIDSCNLPDEFHKDPADRIIVATARTNNRTLITRDTRILDYAESGYLSCLLG